MCHPKATTLENWISRFFPCFFGLCLSCFTLKYYHFFAHHSVFLVGKIAGKRWHRKEIKKFSLLFPHILCQLCEWWCWMDAMKNKIKKVFWHISLLTAPCDLVLFLLHLFKLRRRVVALKKDMCLEELLTPTRKKRSTSRCTNYKRHLSAPR